ncbi:Gfo/Idh/MocA family protein [Cognataquiflexum aquatile]|uniref:Gfo/Idh/MocA family protein n=1 Tax=Cognataquiflexum aquatile TaxID=2249427 RepID=UPI000DE83CC6|nr:Gfo/Idh/MocA family oxidoreductase [Cognataquiflexum aquatile]
MKVLIVGLGSIAQKHIFALNSIDPSFKCFALRSAKNSVRFDSVIDISSRNDIPEDIDFFIISNPTSEHANSILDLLPFGKPLFIEKPVMMNLDHASSIENQISKGGTTTYVACNLRFHPIIKILKSELEKRRPIEFNVYCGSFLPSWRPNQDYTKNYSAIKSLGGGVHLDLIHEIDYTIFLLGKPEKLILAYSDKKSSLNIDTQDIAHYVMDYPDTSVFITLNYYRKFPKRTIELVWEDDVWVADLLSNTIVSSNLGEFYQAQYSIQSTYLEQMKYFTECLKNDIKPMNSFEESIDILKIALDEY